MCLVETRISLFWIVRGQRRKSTSLPSLPGLVLGSPHSSTIGFGGWLLNIIVLRSWFLAGLFTDRAPVGALRPQMNFLTPLFTGLAIQTHGWEQHGRKAKDWRGWLDIGERYCYWMDWSRFKIRPVNKRDGSASLPSRRFCANLPPSIGGFVWLPRGRR